MGVKSFTEYSRSSNGGTNNITDGIYATRFIFNRETALTVN